MKAQFVGTAFYFFSIFCMWLAALLNLVLAFRAMRAVRWNHDIRQVLWAYEHELRERGIRFPPRCAWCCQVLPRHVRGCDMGRFYEGMDKFHEMVSRPPIKWYPKGERPPDLGGKS
jgi:hypothetical protein